MLAKLPPTATVKISLPELRIRGVEGQHVIAHPPSVSCLMVTRDRPRQAKIAIDCFRQQTYPNRDLVVIDQTAGEELAAYVAGDPTIRVIKFLDENANIGRARNKAVEAASGAYICLWDDDDLYDPKRIEMQLFALLSAKAKACFISTWLVWWPFRSRLAVTQFGNVLGASLLCETAATPKFPDVARHEDTPAVVQIMRTLTVASLDAPYLYVYVNHGSNICSDQHFERFWEIASVRYDGLRYEAVKDQLSQRIPMADYAAILQNA